MQSAQHAQDYYSIVGVAGDAGEEEIRAAYRAKARQLHPDLGGSAEEMRLLNNAYEVLSDPSACRAYDSSRIADYTQHDSFTPQSSASCAIESGYRGQYIKTIWRLVLGADCCLFLGLYFVLVKLDPDVSRSVVQSSLALCAAVFFLSSTAVFLYRYHKTTRAEPGGFSPKSPGIDSQQEVRDERLERRLYPARSSRCNTYAPILWCGVVSHH